LLGGFADREKLLELGEIIKRACAQDLRHRYSSADAMQGDLLLLKTGKSVRRTHLLERRLAIMTRIAQIVVAVIVLGAVPYYLAIKEARNAKQEAGRARFAEAEAKEQLRGSYLAQAQAGRWSHRAGRRFGGLDLLKKAAEIHPSLELRNEAIACMVLPDLRVVKEWESLADGGVIGGFDGKYERYVFADPQGTVHLRRLEDEAELAQFPGYEPPFWNVLLSPDSHWLFVA
jgi:hypothetical protein